MFCICPKSWCNNLWGSIRNVREGRWIEEGRVFIYDLSTTGRLGKRRILGSETYFTVSRFMTTIIRMVQGLNLNGRQTRSLTLSLWSCVCRLCCCLSLDFVSPGSRHRSSSRTSSHKFARQKENIPHPSGEIDLVDHCIMSNCTDLTRGMVDGRRFPLHSTVKVKSRFGGQSYLKITVSAENVLGLKFVKFVAKTDNYLL